MFQLIKGKLEFSIVCAVYHNPKNYICSLCLKEKLIIKFSKQDIFLNKFFELNRKLRNKIKTLLKKDIVAAEKRVFNPG